jgi:hypothetical protein
MELSYMVRGTDGKEYGPATLEQISGWISEGRIPAQQEVRRSDMSHWATAGEFSELQPAFGTSVSGGNSATAAAAVATPPAITAGESANAGQQQMAALALTKSGGSWFYWVAALSLINSIAAFSGSSWRFIIGLGITQVFDALGSSLAGGGKLVVLGLDLLVAGFVVLLGVFAVKGHGWAFIVGMVLFALDGLVFLLVRDWIGVGFHAFILWCLFRGFSGCRQLRN